MTKNAWAQGRLFRLRVELDGSEPLIWRRVEVDADAPLEVLHEVFQAAMGWENAHLHGFTTSRKGAVRVGQAMRVPGDQCAYEYDFGDSWYHVLTLEEVLVRRPDDPRAKVLAGERACPPEDVGGIWRYNDIARALAGGTRDPNVDEALEWLPEEFNPAAFDVETANARLARLVGSM